MKLRSIKMDNSKQIVVGFCYVDNWSKKRLSVGVGIPLIIDSIQ